MVLVVLDDFARYRACGSFRESCGRSCRKLIPHLLEYKAVEEKNNGKNNVQANVVGR